MLYTRCKCLTPVPAPADPLRAWPTAWSTRARWSLHVVVGGGVRWVHAGTLVYACGGAWGGREEDMSGGSTRVQPPLEH